MNMKCEPGHLLVYVLASSLVPFAGAQDLLSATFQARSVQEVSGWQCQGNLGGKVDFISRTEPKEGIRLSTTRIERADGKDVWSGCLEKGGKPIVVTPGIRYRLTVEVRGDSDLEMGLFELPWRYSAKVMSRKSNVIKSLSTEWKTYSFDYVATSDQVMAVKPFLSTEGWRKLVDIRSISFGQLPATGSVSLRAQHFVTHPGGKLTVTIESSAYPVKLLLYGPDGTSGPGGSMGGSSAWCDHFKMTALLQGKKGEAVSYQLSLPENSIEGSYRLVAVNPSGNSSAELRFTVRPKAYADHLVTLVEAVNLPANSKIVFLGDSLTDLFRGRNYVSLVDRALKWRHGDNVDVVNSGVGGDNIKRIQKRLERDVISKSPSHVFIFEGANDIKRRYDPQLGKLAEWAVPQPEYENTYRAIIEALKKRTKAKIIILTCAPADQSVTESFAERARTFGISCNFYGLPEEERKVVAIQKKIAADYGLDCVDTNAILNDYLKRNVAQKSRQFPTVDDGVHLSEYGNREMAHAILQYLAGKYAKQE